MKYHSHQRRVPENGETRVRIRFLWLPKLIGREGRWLERAAWEEKAVVLRDTFGTEIRWEPVRWL